MPCFICTTCGTVYESTSGAPQACAICQDERQYVGWGGQQWTSMERLRGERRTAIHLEERGLFGIGLEPAFAIGQRALLVVGTAGNVLWDCIPYLDDGLAEVLQGLGGVSAIAISHPHYYSGMIEWARAFHCPIYLHAADREWVMRPDPAIVFWDGDTLQLPGGLTAIRCGGHFEGGAVLHWPQGAEGRGAILSGDILQVVPDRRWVSFMYSYPNLIPLPARAIHRIVHALSPYVFERVYGAFWGKVVDSDARAAVKRSAERYLRALES